MLTALALAAAGGLSGSPMSSGVDSSPPNVLILLADDLGVDQLASYGLGSDLPATPTIDSLAESGVLFRNAYGNPICAPTRATIMTGRFSFRTGVGKGPVTGGHTMQLSEVTLPEMLDFGGVYSHAAIGKWHLGNDTVGGWLAPNLAGWSHFAGIYDNVALPWTYHHWLEVTDGEVSVSHAYLTTRQVDAALEWIGETDGPWVVYLAFSAVHGPFHEPPAELHTVDLSTADSPQEDPRPYYKAMVEAVDHEIGRLLDGLGDARANTTVIFAGDNGTPGPVVVPPFPPEQKKGSIREGGIHVPFIVSGPQVSVPGAECDGLVNTTDIYASVAELAGFVLPPDAVIDSVSFVPYLEDPAQPSLRDFAFAESFSPNGFGPYERVERAIRGERFKLIRIEPLPDQLYDLWTDPFEQTDLLAEAETSPEASAAYEDLGTRLDFLLSGEQPASTVYGCGVNPAGSLAVAAGKPALGSTVTIAVDNPLGTQAPGSLPTLVFALAPDPAWPCGTLVQDLGMTGYGDPAEFLLSAVPPNPLSTTVSGPAWMEPGRPVELPVTIPPLLGLLGASIYVQGMLADASMSGGPPIALTQAVRLEVGL